MSNADFTGKRVLITGGASGIGEQCAAKLVAAGAQVTVFDRNPCSVEGVEFVQVDMTDSAGLTSSVSALDGSFDNLLNIAGLPPRDGNQVLLYDVNFFALRTLTALMMDKLTDNAAIVNVASLAGAQWVQNIAQVKQLMAMEPGTTGEQAHETLGLPAARAYALTKEAVIVYTAQQTANGMARGIRMNSVSPAAVSTAILDDFHSAFGPKVAENLAKVGRPSEAHEVADLILFLASASSAWVKGCDFVIDGGISAVTKQGLFEF